MIRIQCSGCGSKLNAKDELAGQTRTCPKCGQPNHIPQAGPSAETPETPAVEGAEQHAQAVNEAHLPTRHFPARLDRQNRYLILDKTKLVALWEKQTSGWMLKTGFGFVQATRNYDQLPAQGDFKLVELQMRMADEGLRLDGLLCYQLAKRWALTNLDKGDDKILKSIMAYGFLNKQQKAAVQKILKEFFMRNVWEGATDVLDYLANSDYHSPGTVEVPVDH
jgi:hypothetical protein